MSVPHCALCDSNPTAKAQQTPTDLLEGDYCPVCHQPTCRAHLRIVRWRWKTTRQTDSAQVCERCKRTYQHRYWDSAQRDWIS
ncbi:MAG: hypothetical protein HC915_12980 [Anaerolineae bacterium]|nr:hypothetical protein [Anaerolineae bacterium]